VPGLEKLLYNIFGWIDGTIDKVLFPFLDQMGITMVLLAELSILMLKSRCTPDGRSFTE
jgi:hypothetical protein